MLLQYYLIEEIFKTLRKSIEREQKCKLIPFFFKCTHFDLFLHKKKHRWTFEYRKESVCICSRFKKQDVLEKIITMLNCQLCERISYILWKTRNYFFSILSKSFLSIFIIATHKTRKSIALGMQFIAIIGYSFKEQTEKS